MQDIWQETEQRVTENERDKASLLRWHFFTYLASQSALRPMRGKRQNKKMCFLESASGERLLWDLSPANQLTFWVSRAHCRTRGECPAPDLAKPWNPGGVGRHSALNHRDTFHSVDVCRFTCSNAKEARELIFALGFAQAIKADEGEKNGI